MRAMPTVIAACCVARLPYLTFIGNNAALRAEA
jgi:hypothetical protein